MTKKSSWTPSNLKRLTSGWNDGVTAVGLSAMFGCGINTVYRGLSILRSQGVELRQCLRIVPVPRPNKRVFKLERNTLGEAYPCGMAPSALKTANSKFLESLREERK